MIKNSVTKKHVNMELNSNELIAAFKQSKIIPDTAYDIEITFKVPGGGDYSNTVLYINASVPLYISYKEIIEE